MATGEKAPDAFRTIGELSSELGVAQSVALGDWFAKLPADEQPEVILCSTYLRARETARLVAESSRLSDSVAKLRVDERLREKEFGITDRLTPLGIADKYPDLAEQRKHVGKFYFRPPGGESWCDVILRLRSVLDTITREYRRERVLIIGHQVIVNCFRYLFERLDEETILAVDRAADVPNCGVTSYQFDQQAGKRGKLVLELENFVAPLKDSGTPVTDKPDIPAAPKP